MKIPVWLDFTFKILLLVLTVSTAGLKLWHPSWMAQATADDLENFLTIFALPIVSGVYALLGTGTAPSQTVLGKVALWLVAAIVCLSLLMPSNAMAASKIKLPIPLPPLKPPLSFITSATGGNVTGKPLADLDAVYKAIQSMSLDDLKAAKADADATKDTLASNCYAPLIDLTAAQQSVDTTTLQGKPHVVLTFQRTRDLYNALRPGSLVSIGCSPLAEQVKTDVTTLIAGIAGSTLTMASFGL